MATINGSITLIALPDIFRGIGVNPLPRQRPGRIAASPRPPSGQEESWPSC
jgi:hypothetical protein